MADKAAGEALEAVVMVLKGEFTNARAHSSGIRLGRHASLQRAISTTLGCNDPYNAASCGILHA